MKNRKKFFLIFFLALFYCSCSLVAKRDPVLEKKMNDFLLIDETSSELFKIFLTSDDYAVAQMSDFDLIIRAVDTDGDDDAREEMESLNKINEEREGILAVWLYPDSGQIMKVRMIKPTFLLEVDKLISEDIQRWKFLFPKEIVEPVKFRVKYKVVLQKKLSDEEIIKEMQEKLSEEQ